jgi:hypothetical protein
MRLIRAFSAGAVTVLLMVGSGPVSICQQVAPRIAHGITVMPNVAVGPQYDTTHVYVAPKDFHRFVASLLATFGGTTTKQSIFTVTPTPSRTMSQLVFTPVGTLSVFGFETPIPYPFGSEQTGYAESTPSSIGIRSRRRTRPSKPYRKTACTYPPIGPLRSFKVS